MQPGDTKIGLDLGRTLRDLMDIVGPQESLQGLRTTEGISLVLDLGELALRRRVQQVQIACLFNNGSGPGAQTGTTTLTVDYLITGAVMAYLSGTVAPTAGRIVALLPAAQQPVVSINSASVIELPLAWLLSPFTSNFAAYPNQATARFPVYLPTGTVINCYFNSAGAIDASFMMVLFGWRQRGQGGMWPRAL